MLRVIVDTSDRLQTAAPSSLADLERLSARLAARGVDTVDLGRFAPDLAPDPEWLEQIAASLKQPGALKPASAKSVLRFQKEAQNWFLRRFDVKLLRRGLVLTPGVKEALFHLTLGLVNPGDHVGVPTPSYPFYRTAVRYAGGFPVEVPLRESQDYLPNLSRLESGGLLPRILIINYPHNPTSTPPDRAFYSELVRWARKRNVIVIQDFAYGEIHFDHPAPLSLMNIPGARQVAVELHSFSFTYHVPGLRLGFAVGHPDILRALGETLSRLATNVPEFAAASGALAFGAYERVSAANNLEFSRRRDVLAKGLDTLGWSYRRPAAGGFFWVRSPRRDDARLARKLLMRAGVLVAPGSAFGEAGEGYLRLSLTRSCAQIESAIGKIGKLWPQRLKRMRGTWGPSDSNA
jgi:LL-diaminopimelate aminotransferase